jgi:hypothetical protein
MAYDKTGLRRSVAISADERDALLASGGQRGFDFFKRIWQFGLTTSTGKPTLATMVQTYDCSAATDKQIEDILACGVRAATMNQLFQASAA